MARRTSKFDNAIFAALIVIGIPVFAASKFFEATGVAPGLLVIGLLIGGYFWYSAAKRQRRKAQLTEKYQSEDIAERIMRRTIWEGESAEQLLDSVGQPSAIDDHVLKTKK